MDQKGILLGTTYNQSEEDLQLKIETKKLHSGKCQVKFYVNNTHLHGIYGYTLVEPNQTLKEVISSLKEKLGRMGGVGQYYQQHLFSIGSGQKPDDTLLIFRA